MPTPDRRSSTRIARTLLGVTLPLALLLLGPLSAQCGDLNGIRTQARTDSSSSGGGSSGAGSSSSSSRSPGHCFDDDDEDDDWGIGNLLGGAVLFGATAPFWLPPDMVDDAGGSGYFPDHPYDDAQGSLLSNKDPAGAHDTQVILQGQYGDNFGGISHASGRLILESAWRLGIDTEFYYRHQDGASDQELWTGDFNVVYRFAQNEHWQFRTGLGFNWLADRAGDDYGLNFTYGADWFPIDPLVFSSSIDWGRLGEGTLFHGRSTVGVMQNGIGLYTGYDYFNVGGAGLHAWINGVEVRF